MWKIIFWIIIHTACLTTVMLYFIMSFKRLIAFKEAIIYNTTFFGLFLSQSIIDLHYKCIVNDFLIVRYIEQFFLILSSLYLPLFSNILVNKSKIKLPSIFFVSLIIIGIISLITSFFIFQNILMYSGSIIFIIGAHYSTILLTTCKIKDISNSYSSVIKAKYIKGYCAVFLLFSPFITFGDLFRIQMLNIPKGIYFLPSLFFLKNVFSIFFIFRFLAIHDDKLDIINKSTFIKEVNFTNSERKIIEYLLLGKSNTEIAQILYKSPNTIKDAIKKIYKKCDVSNKTELLFYLKRFKKSPI